VGEQDVIASVVDAGLYGLRISGISPVRVRIDQPCQIEIETGVGPVIVCEGLVRYVSDAGIGIETKETLPIG